MKHKPVQKYDLFFFIAILMMILFLVWSARAQTRIGESDDYISNAKVSDGFGSGQTK